MEGRENCNIFSERLHFFTRVPLIYKSLRILHYRPKVFCPGLYLCKNFEWHTVKYIPGVTWFFLVYTVLSMKHSNQLWDIRGIPRESIAWLRSNLFCDHTSHATTQPKHQNVPNQIPVIKIFRWNDHLTRATATTSFWPDDFVVFNIVCVLS